MRRAAARASPPPPRSADQPTSLPIRVAACDDGTYEVLDGFKRLRSWRANGYEQVPVVVERAAIKSITTQWC